MEETLYKLDLSRQRLIYGPCPAKCQSLPQTFQQFRLHYLQNMMHFTALMLVRSKIPKMRESFSSLPSIFGYLVLRIKRRKTQLKTSSWTKSLFTYRRASIIIKILFIAAQQDLYRPSTWAIYHDSLCSKTNVSSTQRLCPKSSATLLHVIIWSCARQQNISQRSGFGCSFRAPNQQCLHADWDHALI